MPWPSLFSFLSEYQLWNAPKFLFGESYGTARSAVAVNELEQDDDIDVNGIILKLAMGSSMIYLSNAKVIGNIIYSGLLNRFPKLKFVSVESGRESLEPMIERVGSDNVMFQTDFPHATCLYPDPLKSAGEGLSAASEEFRRKVIGKNAVDLYNLPF
jgi:carboxypeptidase C (cathepsin A)